MEETPRRRIRLISAFNEIFTDQLEHRVHGVEGRGGGHYSGCPHPFLQQASGQIFKDDMKVFPPPPIFIS
jgi:hypothetical protein